MQTENLIHSTSVLVSSKGQIVIPKMIRNLMGIQEGSEVELMLKPDGNCEIMPKKKHDISDLFDFFDSPKKGKNYKKPYDDLIGEHLLAEDERIKKQSE